MAGAIVRRFEHRQRFVRLTGLRRGKTGQLDTLNTVSAEEHVVGNLGSDEDRQDYVRPTP
jgi:hypothetical protein